ncbi:hypothetical protein [Pseudomonas syringae group genomosp. 7]|uniref:hypothetical protein n=1 Tax=Pseudomonas syringae group genomosp. 7 TaxID=251699 RepID=UPI000EFDBDDE|nr:hypothetical protein [Pseudomonas syringae group genomosp. 7]RMR06601.1 hypothetical protein ALP93_03965 [Pseudomonas syringae pv. helianthi]
MNEHSNSLLSLILAEQMKQTELLRLMTEQQMMLINALSEEEQADPEAEPTTYMDGTPILGCR